jgi:hypothetical protein
MRHFRFGKTGIGRVDTDAGFGDEFFNAKAGIFNVKHGWTISSDLTTQIMYSGDWRACSEDEAERMVVRLRERSAQPV